MAVADIVLHYQNRPQPALLRADYGAEVSVIYVASVYVQSVALLSFGFLFI